MTEKKIEEHVGLELRIGWSKDDGLFSFEFMTPQGRNIRAVFEARLARELKADLDGLFEKNPTFGLSG